MSNRKSSSIVIGITEGDFISRKKVRKELRRTRLKLTRNLKLLLIEITNKFNNLMQCFLMQAFKTLYR